MIRATLIKCWGFTAVTIIVIALLMTSARLLLPHLNTYHQQIEAAISEAVGATVEFQSMDAAWYGAGPQLKLRGVRLLSGETELLHFERGSVGFNLWRSLYDRALQIDNLVVENIALVITRDEAGKISVAGFEAPASQDATEESDQAQHRAANERALLDWFFSQSRMVIESSSVTWRDLKAEGRELHFSQVGFELRNQGDRHQLNGSAVLPTSLGRSLSFALDIEGSVDSAANLDASADLWHVQGYVDGGELQLAELMDGHTPAGLRVDDGQVETRLWFEWHDAALQRVEGELAVRQLSLMPVATDDKQTGRTQMTIDLISGRYAWQRSRAGWSLTVDDFILDRDNSAWPPSQMRVAMSEVPAGERIIEARLGYANIDDLNALAAMSDFMDAKQRQQLLKFAPTGELREGYLHFRDPSREVKQDYHYVVASRFNDVGINAVGKLPGGQGVDGRVRFDNSGGYLVLDSVDASLSIPKLFRGSLEMSALTGDVYWQQQAGQWQLESRALMMKNNDAEVSLALALKKADGVPEIVLLSDFKAPSVANISHYLPVGIMHDTTIEWLDRAIVDGAASAGQVIFYGPLDSRFPYEESDGLFDIRFHLTDGILDYAPGWPRLEAMEAEVIFTGSRMEINATAAKSLDAEVMQVQARIDDLRARPAFLQLDGKARGHARDTLDFVRRSPLNKRFGEFAERVEVTDGRSTLDLSLKLPLADLPAEVKGVVHFDAADFYLAERGVDILDVKGDLQFSEKGIEIQQAQARLLGMDSLFQAKTMPPSQGGDTIISANGSATAADIQRLLPVSLMDHLEGKAAWQAQLTLPAKDSAVKGVNLKVTSDLKGMAAALPAPLGKSADGAETLVLETVLPLTLNMPVTLQYGPQLRGIFDFNEVMTLQRGAITLGGEPPVLPEKALISVNGKFDRLVLEEWMPLMAAAEGAVERRSESTPVTIGQLNLEIEQASAFGYEFHYTALELALASGLWQGQISNHLIGGALKIPADFKHDSLGMQLDYLILPSLPDKVGEDGDDNQTTEPVMNPQNLPAMNINSRYFSYAGQPYGQLKLLAATRADGLHINHLQLSSPLMNAQASGDWLVENKSQHSAFKISIGSHDFGNMLSTLDIADSIRGGKSEIGMTARWPGAPMAFAMARVNGNMHLKVEDGRLLDVEPGAGRVFGLISLQALPRRLTLDFSDIFKKGFSFDRMEGDFEMNGGNATTSNFSVVGPSASITMTGRVGLVAKDYDQNVIIEPHVASSLPVVGAVVGSLGIGAAILLAQKLLNLDQVTQVKYRVTGPWSDPVVTREAVETIDSPAGQ